MTTPSPSDLLKTLIRFDTTNPPGNEAACIGYIDSVLQAAGIETTIIAKDDKRPNLIARIEGNGSAPPLLLQGHVDVVTTAGQNWTHPPFDAVETDGFIWGRGTLDMKGAVAMYVSAMLQLKAQAIVPNGDIILCILSDEERASAVGAAYLVEEHAHLFADVKHCLGESGGVSTWLAGQKFYPIQVGEKLVCTLRLTINGAAGHGSMPIQGGTMATLGRVLTALDTQQLPVHITPVTRQMINGIASAIGFPQSAVLKLILKPQFTNRVMGLLGDASHAMNPMFRNTVSPTIVSASDKINVIPGQVTVDLDGRMLPGLQPAQLVAEVQAIVGPDVQIDILKADPPARANADLSQFDLLTNVLNDLSGNDGTPIPYLLPAVSDGRFFERLGIQNYGFTPMQTPKGFPFSALPHAADERIPVGAVEFGTAAVLEVLRRYQG